jgi:hypothetical protein
VYDTLEKYKCGQCGGYVWLCDENLTTNLTKSVTKIICKKTKRTQEEYRVMSNSGKKNNKKTDKTDGLVIGVEVKASINDIKKNVRLPSYADYLILKLA